MTQILIVDDERNLRDTLAAMLSLSGYETAVAGDAQQALVAVAARDPDLILLDVMMPDIDGIALLPELRRRSTAPVMMLTARGELDFKTIALDSGADDYLPKPFAPEELLARIRALLRRPKPMRTPLLRYRDLELDPVSHHVRRAGMDVQLSPREFKLLETLLSEQGRVFSKPQLLDRVWGVGAIVGTETLDKFVSLLRRKLRAEGETLIQTVHGVGYVLRASRSE
jgi:DNA-binding response OmpR family regulator